MSDTWLVAGLGNPGRQYAATRHSIGLRVIDELVSRARGSLSSTRAKAHADVVRMGSVGGVPGPRTVLVAPTTYMNVSGPPIAQLASFYSVPPERIVVIHDDVDLPFEAVRLKRGGGEGGHNGLRSLSQVLGTRDYLRVRAGVGRPPERMDTADFVLQAFSTAENVTLPIFIGELADAVEELITRGLESAQSTFHTRTGA